MNITRHFVDVGSRRVHYRRCGGGPALLMVHQSPRSSAEYEALMRRWGAYFTCIAPDTPGFGQSAPLGGDDAGIGDFADALIDLLDALGLDRVGAYGFHSGGIILVAALSRHPERFSCLAVGGYAVWTPEETALFGDRYLPPFRPSAYGEHLTWLWNRVLEQTWFFPWFAAEPRYALGVAHDDPARIDAVVRELLDAGDAYRVGYGAVLRAPRDIPAVDAVMPPVLITAHDGDPLQPHLDRLGDMPAGWSAHPVATPDDHQAASLAFLRLHPAAPPPELGKAPDEGFLLIATGRFDGAIHWRGRGGTLRVHAPGRALTPGEGIAIDLPGHGLSSGWLGAAPTDWEAWAEVIGQAAMALGAPDIAYEQLPPGDPGRLFPPLAPDRFGSYLTAAWGIVRAGRCFEPWYAANAAAARAFDPRDLVPELLARDHRDLLRARAAKEYCIARTKQMETEAG